MYCVNVTVYANQVYVEFQKKNGALLGEDFVYVCERFVK